MSASTSRDSTPTEARARVRQRVAEILAEQGLSSPRFALEAHDVSPTPHMP